MISYYNFSKIASFWIDNPHQIYFADKITLLEFYQAFVINIVYINRLPETIKNNLHVIFEDVCVVLLTDHFHISDDLFYEDCEFDFSGLEVI